MKICYAKMNVRRVEEGNYIWKAKKKVIRVRRRGRKRKEEKENERESMRKIET